MSTMTTIYRPSQYSLFPTCLPLPPTNENIANFSCGRHFPSSARERQPAAKESPRVTNSDGANNIFVGKILKHSKAMSRLIPFKLQPSEGRSSIEIPSPPTTSAEPDIHSRPGRRGRPGPVTELIILPYTQEEWKKVMEEVKIYFLKGHYKQCSMRCQQILDSIKDPIRVHPLYSIWLSFYAASSLEQTARSLHNNSSSKLPLFHEALSYYRKAESHMEYASFSADPNFAHLARQNTHHHSVYSLSSSSRSSLDSVFSQAESYTGSTCSSIATSPTDRETQRRNMSTSSSLTSTPLKCKKRVSFSMNLVSSPEQDTDAQPKTPGIGIDEATIIDAFPRPPTRLEASHRNEDPFTISPLTTAQAESQRNEDTLSMYLLTLSITRYRSHLASLSTQLRYHISSIHTQISLLSGARKGRRSGVSGASFTDGGKGLDGVDRKEMKKAEIRERIRRLKEGGWKRKRFEGERYRVLCQMALEEVEGKA